MIAPDEFAEVIEKIDNLRGALEIPMPAGFHVNQMKRELEEVSDKLKRSMQSATTTVPRLYTSMRTEKRRKPRSKQVSMTMKIWK